MEGSGSVLTDASSSSSDDGYTSSEFDDIIQDTAKVRAPATLCTYALHLTPASRRCLLMSAAC